MNKHIPKKMNALVLHDIGKIKYEQVDIPQLEKDMVLVKIIACGICSSDKERIFLTGTYNFPTIPGHEIVGTIVATESVDDYSLIEKSVCIYPLLPCRKCQACQDEKFVLCENYNYFGSRCDGGFAEYLVVPKWNLIFLDDLSSEIGALIEPSAVSLNAVNIGKIMLGDTIAVVGTGIIGFVIAFIAKLYGAKVTICCRNPRAYEFAKENGLDAIYSEEISSQMIFDKVYEAVGTNDSISLALKLAKPSGTVILVGNPKSDLLLKKEIYWKILRKQLTVKGVWNSNYNSKTNDWYKVIEIMKKNTVFFQQLITRTFKLSEYQEAFDLLCNKDAYYLKILFKDR